MAFSANDIKRVYIGPSSGAGLTNTAQKFFHRTADAKATVLAAGYFNAYAAQVNKGDVIDSVTDLGTTPKGLQLVVTAVTASTVTVALFDAT